MLRVLRASASSRPLLALANGAGAGPLALSPRCLSTVALITSEEEYEKATSNEGLSVVYFTAAWCGPCQRIAPLYAQLAKENPSVSFVKVDVDEMSDITAEAGVNAMPTFHFVKASKVVDTIVGADDRKLADYVRLHQ